MRASIEHIYRRRIHFSETDAAGVAHFTALASLVEEAEHDFFLTKGVAPFAADSGWPRVAFSVQYEAPCFFGEEVAVMLTDFSVAKSSVSYSFRAEKEKAGEAVTVFRGAMTICHVRRNLEAGAGAFSPEPIGEVAREALFGFRSCSQI